MSILQHLGGFPAQKHEIAGEGGGAIKVKDETEGRSPLDIARRVAFLLERAARTKQVAAKAGKSKATDRVA